MAFELRLCLALGITLSQLRESPLEDYGLWLAYEQLHGFPLSRLEATTAMSGAAVCQTWGAKVKPRDLLPVYEQPKQLSYTDGIELFRAQFGAGSTR